MFAVLRRGVVAILMVGAVAVLIGSHEVTGKPPSREEFDRESQVLEQLKTSVAAANNNADKFALIEQTLSREPSVELRRRVLDLSATVPGAERESFLFARLNSEEDAGLRSQAATALGRTGSEKSLPVLVKIAASDRTTSCEIGCMHMKSSARRAAMFSVAELCARFPKLADQAASQLRVLPVAADPQDRESLYDARNQALYQITQDESLLKPYFDQLKSVDVKERTQGIIAFQFFKLKKAPPEVVQALRDTDQTVRSWTALVLGGIGDPDSVDVLLAVATDPKLDKKDRRVAIVALGQMRAKSAAGVMEKLLTDKDLAAHADIALYRMTGRKTSEFPEGYNAE